MTNVTISYNKSNFSNLSDQVLTTSSWKSIVVTDSLLPVEEVTDLPAAVDVIVLEEIEVDVKDLLDFFITAAIVTHNRSTTKQHKLFKNSQSLRHCILFISYNNRFVSYVFVNTHLWN